MTMQINVFGLFGLSVICGILCVVIRRQNPEHAFTVTLGCICVAAVYLLGQISEVVTEMAAISSAVNLGFLDNLYKAVGISIVGSLAADVCNDYGQSSLAGIVTLAGRFAILILSLPLFREILTIALELVG